MANNLIGLIYKIHKLEYSNNQNSIPKIIHQFAPSDKTRWPKVWERCQKSWQKNFNDWEYKLWDDESLDSFMQNNYPEFYSLLYTKYKYDIQRFDAARYFILYHYGGMYADMDYFCVTNFTDQLPVNKVSIAESENKQEKYQNALIISPKNHIFWHHLFKMLILGFDINLENVLKPDYLTKKMFYVLATTGPILIENVIKLYSSKNINILNREKFSLKNNEAAYHISTGIWVDIKEYKKEISKIYYSITEKWLEKREGIY